MTVHARSEHARGAAAARRLRERARRYLSALGRENAELSILVVGDAAIRQLNRTWRGKDRPTDVLSFPLSEPGHGSPARGTRRQKAASPPRSGSLLGDVVISLDTAIRVSRRDGRPVEIELDRYLAHGLLHLLGHDHRWPGEARRMAAEENALVGEGMVSSARPERRLSEVPSPSLRLAGRGLVPPRRAGPISVGRGLDPRRIGSGRGAGSRSTSSPRPR